MKTTHAAAAIAVTLLALAWFFRWEPLPLQRGESAPVVYMLDRWTGNVRMIHGDTWFKVEQDKP